MRFAPTPGNQGKGKRRCAWHVCFLGKFKRGTVVIVHPVYLRRLLYLYVRVGGVRDGRYLGSERELWN